MALLSGFTAGAQTTYQPKFKGDSAQSDPVAAALDYMRTVFTRDENIRQYISDYAGNLG
jgi:hypothetical protein